jgi:trk system potassium uptake protein TrkA
MKTVLLIGLGRFGRHVARRLYDLDHQVLAVDSNEDCVNRVLPFVTGAQIGDSTNPTFLAALGVKEFDVCIVAIGDDFQSSLETTALLEDRGAQYVVARAARDVHARFLARNGADEVIYPERQLAEWTAIRYSSNHILDYTPLSNEYAVYEVEIPANWAGKSLAALDLRRRHQINVFAIKQGDLLITEIDPDAPLRKNQTLLVIGKNKEVDKCFQ